MFSRLIKTALATALAIPVLAAGATAAETIKVQTVAGHPPVFRWVKHLSKTFIPTVNAELAKTGKYQIKWTESYGGTLAKVGGELEAVEEGLAEIGLIPTVFEPAKMPLQNVAYYTPFGPSDPLQVVEVIERLQKQIPAMMDTWAKNNLVYLGCGFGIDEYHIWTQFPVKSLADLKGHKIGAPGPAVNWLKGTGAVGVSGNLTLYYNNLKTGVYEGVIVFGTAAMPGKLYEVAPYITKVSLATPYAGGVAANKDWFDQQPQEVKDALKKGGEACKVAYHKDLNAAVATAFKIMADKGAKISTLPPAERKKWADVLPNKAKEWAQGLDKKGLPGTKVLSAYMEALRQAGVKPERDWDKE